MVEEELTEEAEVPTPAALSTAINLEEGEVVISIDFVTGRVQERAFGSVSLECEERVGVAEAEFANIDDFRGREGGRVGGKVPRFDLVGAHLNAVEIANSRHFSLVLRHATPSAEFFNLLLARIGACLLWI